MKTFNVLDHVSEIAAVFEGMNDEYVELVRSYHSVFLDETRTDEYKRQVKAQTVNAINDLVNGRVQAAKDTIENIKAEYTGAGQDQEPGASEKLFNLMYWKEILPEADYNELQELYTTHKRDPLFVQMLYREFNRREREKPENFNLTDQQELKAEIEGRQDFPGLKKIEITLNHIANIAREHYTDGIPEWVRGEGNIKYRNIGKDLAKFPVKDGHTFRPVFRLGVQ